MMKRLLLSPALPFALALLLPASLVRAEPTAAVELTFEVGERRGAVMVALFDSEATYGGGEPVQATAAPVGAGPVKVRFEGLRPGRYAVKAFHDLDGDTEMDTNVVGLPTEPFAFSNNAPPRGGPPEWSAASFEVDAGGAAQTLVIR